MDIVSVMTLITCIVIGLTIVLIYLGLVSLGLEVQRDSIKESLYILDNYSVIMKSTLKNIMDWHNISLVEKNITNEDGETILYRIDVKNFEILIYENYDGFVLLEAYTKFILLTWNNTPSGIVYDKARYIFEGIFTENQREVLDSSFEIMFAEYKNGE